MNTKRHHRRRNFTTEEKNKFLKLLSKYKKIITNKKTDGRANEAKSKTWQLICRQFNASGDFYRSKASLVKQWDKMKSRARLFRNDVVRSTIDPDREPLTMKNDPILEKVCFILGYNTSEISKEVEDSNENLNNIDEIMSNEDSLLSEFTLSGPSPISIPIMDHMYTNLEDDDVILHEEIEPEPSVKKLLKSKLSSFSSSSINNYDKKEDLEILKLMEEIEFNRKIHKIKIQIAQKELEVKTAILKKLKSGY